METESHTPGPWYACGTDLEGMGNIRSDNHPDGTGALLFNIGGMFHEYTPDRDEERANLRLVATAPDMLDALRQTLDIVEAECASDYLKIYRPGWARAIKKARAAIAKATD